MDTGRRFAALGRGLSLMGFTHKFQTDNAKEKPCANAVFRKSKDCVYGK